METTHTELFNSEGIQRRSEPADGIEREPIHEPAQKEVIRLPLDAVIYRDDLYPRIEPDPSTIQRYAEDLEVLPPIEVNQYNHLIDGYHRWTAHKKAKADTIRATVTPTASDVELLALAAARNAQHGLQLNLKDKKKTAIRLYASGTGLPKDEIARLLSVSARSVNNYLSDIDKALKEEREQTIRDMWLACHTQEEIAEQVGIDQSTVARATEELCKLESFPKRIVFATYAEPDWTPPLYNIWSFATKSNKVGHFGNTEQAIVDRLLYLYTSPLSIVVDPFAGGGSTIDVCKHRLRRYWVSDRLPIVERTDIRQHDITDGPPPLHKRWQDVSLVYLDPPYWRQARGQYSNDGQDLANMELDAFYGELVTFIEACAEKMVRNAHIALIIQPTQWLADDRCYPVDHVFDLVQRVTSPRLRYQARIICPYPTEQYNAQQVEWAKEHSQVLTLNRELVVWSVQ